MCIRDYSDRRIRYIKHEKNLGQNHALNTGMRFAQGELISFLDSDDEWLPLMLERVLERFRSDEDIGCVYASYGVKDSSGHIQAPIGNTLEGYIYKEALELGQISPPTTLSVRRECFDVVGTFEPDVIVCQDDVMCLKLAKAFKFGRVKEVLATMHYDGGGRLSEDPVLTAYGYYYLCNRFGDDIVKYCGRETMAKYYADSGMLFLDASESNMAFKAFCKSLTRGLSAKATLYMAFSLLPHSYQRKVRSARRGMIHGWRSSGHGHR
jgi:glycosyltransferase involved in cell wall biosynthesis